MNDYMVCHVLLLIVSSVCASSVRHTKVRILHRLYPLRFPVFCVPGTAPLTSL